MEINIVISGRMLIKVTPNRNEPIISFTAERNTGPRALAITIAEETIPFMLPRWRLPKIFGITAVYTVPKRPLAIPSEIMVII